MVDVPPELFLETVTERRVYYLKTDKLNTDIPHYFICVKCTQDEIVFMTCSTSQKDTINKFITTRDIDPQTIVYIDPKAEENPYYKDTYVNCNDVFPFTTTELRDMYECNEISYSGEISENHFHQIIKGISKSRLVEIETKELITS